MKRFYFRFFNQWYILWGNKYILNHVDFRSLFISRHASDNKVTILISMHVWRKHSICYWPQPGPFVMTIKLFSFLFPFISQFKLTNYTFFSIVLCKNSFISTRKYFLYSRMKLILTVIFMLRSKFQTSSI